MLARQYHLTPLDVWSLTLEQFFLFVQDHEVYLEALNNR